MARIPDHTREAIADDLKAGKARNAIAREHGVAFGTVTNIAAEIGVSAGDRTATKQATAAKQVDIAARQAELAQLLLQDAFDLRERAWEDQKVIVTYKDSSEIVEIPTPAGDFRNFYTSIGIIVDKVNVLTRDDSDGMAAVDSWLRSLGVGNTQ